MQYYTEMAAIQDQSVHLIDKDKDKTADGDYETTEKTKVLYNLGKTRV